jgi:hypothetical protein
MPLPDSFIVAAALTIASTAQTDQPAAKYPPFQFQDVGFTKDCQPNEAFERLITLLTGPTPKLADDQVPDFDEPLYNAVSGDRSYKLMLDEPKAWNGLRLNGVSLYFGIERGPANYILTFEENAETVRTVWNKLGWKLPAVNQSRDVEGLEGYAFIGVSGDDNGGQVGCFRD